MTRKIRAHALRFSLFLALQLTAGCATLNAYPPLAVGMDTAQVMAAWGRPSDVVQTAYQGQQTETWIYNRSSYVPGTFAWGTYVPSVTTVNVQYVYFDGEGKVIGWTTSTPQTWWGTSRIQ